MCGIMGWVGCRTGTPGEEVFAAALDLIRHRGPDGGKLWIDKGVCLGHRRLAIVDLAERAEQPMQMHSHVIVFNGEIYNYKILRSKLEALGHSFSTSSDSEVLLCAWLQWGRDCLTRLEGMFAFAIWDKHNRTLHLARDRFGEKPLFYYFGETGISFASELPPLIRIAGKNILQESDAALSQYFQFSYTPAPRSILKGVEQVLPGAWLQWTEPQGISKGTYYDLRSEVEAKQVNTSLRYQDTATQLRNALTEATRLRIESADVPVATLLSGGLDSSIITMIASKVSTSKIRAYSLGFPDDPEFDETTYAKEVARSLPNVEHCVVEVTEDSVRDSCDRVLESLGEPFADASIIPTSLICSQVDEKVALGGDAADELFAGYGVYPAIMMGASIPRWLRCFLMNLSVSSNPALIKNSKLRAAAFFLNHLKQTSWESYLSWRTYADVDRLSSLKMPSAELDGIACDNQFDLGGLKDIQMMDIMFNLPNDMLKKVDYAAMMHGLEVRLPFLDSNIVEFALKLPDRYKIYGKVRKKILKDAFSDVLPPSITGRSKKGFLLPIRSWFRDGNIREDLIDLVESQNQIDSKECDILLQEHSSGKYDHSVFLWSIYVYLKWKSQVKYWIEHKAPGCRSVTVDEYGCKVVRYH